MNREIVLKHEFVEFLPAQPKQGTIYISIRFGTASHLCVCGCGNKVVTPLRPTDWKLIYDGKTVSLDPSIGNWSFACHSHYWIQNNRVQWATSWSTARIEAARAHDQKRKDRYFRAAEDLPTLGQRPEAAGPPQVEEGFWRRLKKKLWPR
jgi:hypothetical protein